MIRTLILLHLLEETRVLKLWRTDLLPIRDFCGLGRLNDGHDLFEELGEVRAHLSFLDLIKIEGLKVVVDFLEVFIEIRIAIVAAIKRLGLHGIVETVLALAL